jgi:REP element-mobilizing transposase RayT
MVQILPTRKPAPKPTNPTNGSWWMVQIQPIRRRAPKLDCSDPTLHRNRLQLYPRSMYLTPFTSLAWAYQLHYYLCFRTHRRRSLFASKAVELTELISEICVRHNYHLLECQPHPDELRCLVSLQPTQPISKVMQTIKTNSSRECSQQFDLTNRCGRVGFSRKA